MLVVRVRARSFKTTYTRSGDALNSYQKSTIRSTEGKLNEASIFLLCSTRWRIGTGDENVVCKPQPWPLTILSQVFVEGKFFSSFSDVSDDVRFIMRAMFFLYCRSLWWFWLRGMNRSPKIPQNIFVECDATTSPSVSINLLSPHLTDSCLANKDFPFKCTCEELLRRCSMASNSDDVWAIN